MRLFLSREFGADGDAEPLVYDASCALREGALLSQGRLFVFSSRMCFYSNVFGITRRLSLPFSRVSGFAKRRLAAKGAFGALEVSCTDGKAVTLVSFWDRSKALRVLQSTWQAWKEGALHARGDAAAEESPRSSSSSSSGSTDDPASRPPSARSMPPAVLATEPPSLEGLAQLQLTDDGPTMQLPCTIGGIYTLCLSDGSNFTQVRVPQPPPMFVCHHRCSLTPRLPIQAFRAARGEWDVEVPMWSDEAEAAHVRCVTWKSPLEAHKHAGLRLPGIPAYTRIQEQQRCMAFSHQGGAVRLVLQFTSSQLDIPWGKEFSIESRLELCAPAEDAHATASGYARVRWLRQPSLSFIRHEVERRSMEGTEASMRQLLHMASSYLRNAADVPDSSRQAASSPAAVCGVDAPPGTSEVEAAADAALPLASGHRDDSLEAIRYAPVAFSAVCDALRTSDGKGRSTGGRAMSLWALARWVALLLLLAAVFICGRNSAQSVRSS